MGRKRKQYAVYKGDEFLMIGEVEQIVREIGITESSVYRIASLQKHYVNSRRYDSKIIVIPIEDKEERMIDEMITDITNFCMECPKCESCVEKECILFRLEQGLLKLEEEVDEIQH